MLQNIWKHYKIYKNTILYINITMYKNATQLVYKINSLWNSTIFAKEPKTNQLPENCLLDTAFLTLSVLLGIDDGKKSYLILDV